MNLNDSIKNIKGIGEKKARAFAKLGVFSLYDLLSFFPRRYEDRSKSKSIIDFIDGESACVDAFIADEPQLVRIRRGLDMVKFRIADESGICHVTYFNQSYIKGNLHKGEQFVFYGKMSVKGAHRAMTNPVYEHSDHAGIKTCTIVPVYRLVSGLSQKDVIQSMHIALDECEGFIPELMPETVINKMQLARTEYAYRNIHFPSDFKCLEIARRRLVFEELFILACALGKMRSESKAEKGIIISPNGAKKFIDELPFSLTDAQEKAINEASDDMASGAVMHRLIQGDVGSGKTVVAAALCLLAARSGKASVFMTPTEILARQHYKTLSDMLCKYGIRTALLTGSTSAKERRSILSDISSGKTDLIIGTHALFSPDIEYNNLALVITDEQHRFGVAQRSALINKGNSPHVLVMSATPIPRTLALIIYGDLDVSVIDKLPPGRQSVDTFAVDSSYRRRLNEFIRKQCSAGHQVFVVCPAIEDNEDSALNLKSAEEFSEELKNYFNDLRISCVHGKMKSKEKASVMSDFVSGNIDILVSTTVIEVGIDVPNATLMIIENAERFGLSQLHQLRGRVGRGSAKSFCVLVSDSDSEATKARLNIMCKTNDGFKISEEDLRLRGPGDFFGSRQHGLPEMHLSDLGADTKILKKAQEEATEVLASDPGLNKLENKNLREHISKMFIESFAAFN